MAPGTPPGRRPRPTCSNTSRCSPPAHAAIPPSVTSRQPSSWNAGSRLSMRKNWQHEAYPLEDEKQREPQIEGLFVVRFLKWNADFLGKHFKGWGKTLRQTAHRGDRKGFVGAH